MPSTCCRRPRHGASKSSSEGFANIYSEVAAAIKAARNGERPPEGVEFPTIADGVKGIAFIEAASRSSNANGKWVTYNAS